MRPSPLICALSLCLLLHGCADTAERERAGYVVRPQDTLYSIAWRYGLDFHDLARWNNIGPDFRIAVGQALTAWFLASGRVTPLIAYVGAALVRGETPRLCRGGSNSLTYTAVHQ